MISVIVPVYNAGEYLGPCIDSILCQDYREFELLLIDDGSSDGSSDICDRYARQDERIRCFHQANSGVGLSRNFGIEQARGEWICFIDSDDRVKADYLSAFDTEKTSADIVITGIDFVNVKSGAVIRREQYEPTIIDLKRDRHSLMPFLLVGYPVAKAYRRESLIKNNLRFPVEISFHEDHVFVFDCYLHSKMIEVKGDTTYIYQIDYTNQSLSKRRYPWQKHRLASNYMFDRIFRIRTSFGYDDEDLRDIYTFAYGPVISAVYDLYDSGCGRAERKSTLRGLLKGDLPIEKYFYPQSGRGKLIKKMSRLLPLPLLDVFFKCVNRYQNRRK